MALYKDLDPADDVDERIITRLLELRQAFTDHGVPDRTLNDTLLLATWNIRDFDKAAFGERKKEAIFYIAEIIEQFDLIALQEINRDLDGLRRVLDLLGPNWSYIATDTTEGDSGNDERLVFLYDTRKVQLGGVVSEVVLPPLKDDDGETIQPRQFSRTPYLVAFRAGWARFMLANVHIDWGVSKAEPQRRIDEIANLAQFMRARTEDPFSWSRNVILLGDFNIWDKDDKTMKALTHEGFEIPQALIEQPEGSNAKRNRDYDQIAFHVNHDRLGTTGKAGIFNYYDVVFTEEDLDNLYSPISKTDGTPPDNEASYYRIHWRTHQMSDHLPMWCELHIDYSQRYLERILTGDV